MWIGAALAAALAVACSSGVGAEVDVRLACQDWVKDKLKAPATAEFSDIEVVTDGDVYTFTGAVDAENSFGAKLRNRWTCKAQDTGDTVTRLAVTLS